MRGHPSRVDHSSLRLLYALSTLLDWEDPPGRVKECHQMEDIQAVCHAMTMFYPSGAERFLEAVLSISEKARGFAPKAVGDFNARRCKGRRPATETAIAVCAPLNSDKT